MNALPYRRFFLATLLLLISCASNTTSNGEEADPFVGVWNYDQPNLTAGTNIAALECPAAKNGAPAFSTQVPQIGNITFEKSGSTGLRGITDQGCSWSFVVSGSQATMSPPAQSCFNKVIGSRYTITRWTLRAEGDHAVEELQAISHQAVDCPFALGAGARTKVNTSKREDTERFVGSWFYLPPDALQTNVASVACMQQMPSFVPVMGTIMIERSGDHLLTATEPLGCKRQLRVLGNTAELVPGDASCGHALSFWSMASDGKQLAQIQSGKQGDCAFVLTNSRLERQ
jgi:hypothetical protein